MSSIAVVIVNYNTRELLRACLASVRAEEPVEVVVVDNASADGTVEMVAVEYPEVKLYSNKVNSGYGAAANQAIAACAGKYILLLNADTLLKPGTLSVLSAYLDDHPRAAVVGPRLVDSAGILQASSYPFPTPLHTFLENSIIAVFLGRWIRRSVPALGNIYLRTWMHADSRIVPWLKGAALAIRREAFEAVGGFDESFFMYFEDADLCRRLGVSGWESHFTAAATVVHVGGGSTGQCRDEMAVQLFASTLKFYERHSSKLCRAQVVVIMKALMLARWFCGSFRLCFNRDAIKRSELLVSLNSSRRILLDHW
jgi:GT2 family glycosyltransferase